MAGIEEILSNIRNLSKEKQSMVESLEGENENLRGQLEHVCLERDAFIDENKLITEVLREEGLQQFAMEQPIKYLLKERADFKTQIQQLEEQKAVIVQELDDVKSTFDKAKKDYETDLTNTRAGTNEVGRRLQAMLQVHEEDETKLKTERDHYKSELEKNSEKLAKLEAELKQVNSRRATENTAHEEELRKLRHELEGKDVSIYSNIIIV